MPYDPKDRKTWPRRIRKLPAKKGRQWCAVWNSTYESTGDEGRAFAAANAVVFGTGEPQKA